MGLTCFLNDQWLPLEQAGIPVADLAVQRGYGIFDFIRAHGDTPLYIDDHLDRFYHSASKMRLEIGYERGALKKIIKELLKRNALPHSGLRLLLTGGESPDGYQIVKPNLAIIQQPLSSAPGERMSGPIKLVTYSHMREMPHIKTTNYLMAVWLRPWLKEKAADDVLYHLQGIVSECPRSNFFLVREDDTILTPSRNILRGITRKQIIEVCAANQMPLEETDILLSDISKAKAAFISSSTTHIVPVAQIDEHRFASVEENPVMQRLFQYLMEKEMETLSKPWI